MAHVYNLSQSTTRLPKLMYVLIEHIWSYTSIRRRIRVLSRRLPVSSSRTLFIS